MLTTAQLHSSHMLKILQAKLQQYVNDELPDDQASFMFYFSLLRKIFLIYIYLF